MLQQEFNASCEPIHPCGIEIKGVDLAGMGGKMPPKLAGAVEVLMAEHGQGLTLVHFPAQLEPCLTQENTLHTLHTP